MSEDTAHIYKKQRRRRLLAITGVLLVVVVAGAAGVGLRLFQTREQDPAEFPSLPSVVQDLQSLRLSGNEDAFNDEIEAVLANPDLDDETRYMVLLHKGHAHADNEEWQEAIDAYLAADQVQATFEVAEVLGDSYASSGDVENAIRYYELAIERNPVDNPIRDADNDAFRQKIRQLEEG
jgi:tetratricopeptide (TPR) repeat protein